MDTSNKDQSPKVEENEAPKFEGCPREVSR